MKSLPNIPSKKAGKKWILKELKESMFQRDWRELKKYLEIMDDSQLKLLYSIVSDQLVNRNGYVVEFNELITSLVGCNTCIMPMGNLVQSKSALFYLSPYVSKHKFEVQHALLTLDKARSYVEKFPSIAEDSGSKSRSLQHWLTRTLNSLDNTMEVADTQATAALLDMDVEISTECYAMVGIHQAYQYLYDHRIKRIEDEEFFK